MASDRSLACEGGKKRLRERKPPRSPARGRGLTGTRKKMAFFGLLSSLMETAMEMHDELISAVESESDNRPAEVACEVGGGEGRNAGEVPAAGVPEHQVDQERSYIPAPSQPRLNDESEPEKFEVSDVNESSDL
jgi:hypothetical protein